MGKEHITTYKRGHRISFDNGTEYYVDNGESTEKERPCTRCGEMPTHEGFDACLGKLTGVVAACCGHGKTRGYILFENGIRIEGHFIVEKRDNVKIKRK
jgi:ribosomal protein S27AE